MKTVIYKNENKAKTYKLTSKIDQGVYNAGDFIMNIKTDNIELFISDSNYEFNIEIL